MIFSTKITSSFVVALAVLAGVAKATPTTERSSHYANHHTSAFDFDKSFKTLTGNAHWILDQLTAVITTTIDENFRYVASWIADIVVRMEFLVMADGSHFMFPESGQPDVEQKHREIAVAVWKLLRNLKTMERTDEVIKNVMIRTLRGPANATRNSSRENKMSAFLSTYFETMDLTFGEDEVLGVEYKKQKVEAKKEAKPNAKMHEAVIKVWEYTNKILLSSVDKETITAFLRDKEIIRQAYANKIFMKEAVKNIVMIFNKTHLERYSLAIRALIKKANVSSKFDSKVNQVYQKALFRAGGVMYMYETTDVIEEVLFDAIEKGVKADRTLHKEILASMIQIQSSVVYDDEMLHFDFSPL